VPGKPDLSDVTLCAADSVQPDLAARALETSLDRCRFGDAILFSDKAVVGRFRHVRIAPLNSLSDYSYFVLRHLAALVRTRFALIVQWDGYVVDRTAWREQFRKFDYIGAPIHTKEGDVVGNGGFSLRSSKLLQATATLPIVKQLPEDILVSVTFRKLLEKDFGIRFAPLNVAQRFSYELGADFGSTFGFHGQFNLWRYETDEEVIRILNQRPRRVVFGRDSFALVVECLKHGRLGLAAQIYALFRKDHDTDFMWRHLSRQNVPYKAFRLAVDALEATATNSPTAFRHAGEASDDTGRDG
jgi:hypothetical protein